MAVVQIRGWGKHPRPELPLRRLGRPLGLLELGRRVGGRLLRVIALGGRLRLLELGRRVSLVLELLRRLRGVLLPVLALPSLGLRLELRGHLPLGNLGVHLVVRAGVFHGETSTKDLREHLRPVVAVVVAPADKLFRGHTGREHLLLLLSMGLHCVRGVPNAPAATCSSGSAGERARRWRLRR